MDTARKNMAQWMSLWWISFPLSSCTTRTKNPNDSIIFIEIDLVCSDCVFFVSAQIVTHCLNIKSMQVQIKAGQSNCRAQVIITQKFVFKSALWILRELNVCTQLCKQIYCEINCLPDSHRHVTTVSCLLRPNRYNALDAWFLTCNSRIYQALLTTFINTDLVDGFDSHPW